MKTRSERRHDNWKKALRKQDIIQSHHGLNWYDNLHQYSKNKIHCSCPMCRCKTNDKQVVGSAMNWPVGDQKKLDDMRQQVSEYYEGDDVE